jgi:hypothetical protein
MSKTATIEFEGLEVEVYRGEDGKLVVQISGPGEDDLTDSSNPDIRIWLNDCLTYAHGDGANLYLGDYQATSPPAQCTYEYADPADPSLTGRCILSKGHDKGGCIMPWDT